MLPTSHAIAGKIILNSKTHVLGKDTISWRIMERQCESQQIRATERTCDCRVDVIKSLSQHELPFLLLHKLYAYCIMSSKVRTSGKNPTCVVLMSEHECHSTRHVALTYDGVCLSLEQYDPFLSFCFVNLISCPDIRPPLVHILFHRS